jgi:copper chaperone CopZ
LRPAVDYDFAAVIGAGTVINPIIKSVTTIAILAAVYFLILRPVFDTTNDIIEKTGESIHDASRQSQQALHDSNVSSAKSQASSYVQSLQSGWPAAAREVRGCVQKAGEDLGQLNHCVTFAQRLVHTVQSDRSFALSYADSLESQGKSADAERVRDCVKDAGFETAAMQRCRNLADDLLF